MLSRIRRLDMRLGLIGKISLALATAALLTALVAATAWLSFSQVVGPATPHPRRYRAGAGGGAGHDPAQYQRAGAGRAARAGCRPAPRSIDCSAAAAVSWPRPASCCSVCSGRVRARPGGRGDRDGRCHRRQPRAAGGRGQALIAAAGVDTRRAVPPAAGGRRADAAGRSPGGQRLDHTMATVSSLYPMLEHGAGRQEIMASPIA